MASTGETWRLGRRPALDGVRGIAVTLVLLSHLGMPGSGISGAVGVVVFFALSGFLITTLLLDRREPLHRFYLRRAARLVPAMLACVVLSVGLELAVTGTVSDGRDVLATLTYSSNWLYAGFQASPSSGVAHLWSLSVEEQFYLLWPMVLLGLARLPRRWALTLVGFLILASVYVRLDVWAVHGYMPAYYRFDARADELLIGCALALVMRGRRERQGWQPVAAVMLAAVLALSWSGDPFGVLWMPTLGALATAVVLWVAVNGRQAWLAPRWLVWVGQRSYAIYLYHWPLRWAMHTLGLPTWATAVIVLPVTFALAEVSWRCLEQPVIRAVARRAATAHCPQFTTVSCGTFAFELEVCERSLPVPPETRHWILMGTAPLTRSPEATLKP